MIPFLRTLILTFVMPWSAMAADALEILFQWREVEGGDQYVIEISEDADFQTPLMIERATKTEYQWTTNHIRKVYWRVAADGKRKGLFSKPQLLDIADLLKNPARYKGVSLKQSTVQTPPPNPNPLVASEQTSDTVQPVSEADPELESEIAIPFQVNLHFGGGLQSVKLAGSDFETKIAGAIPTALRAGAIIPISPAKSLILEVEWNQFSLTPEPAERYPFQNPVLLSTSRARAMFGSETSLIYGLSYRNILRPRRLGPEQIEFFSRSLLGASAGIRGTLKTFDFELLAGAHFGERLSQADLSLRTTTPVIPFDTWSIVLGLQLEADLQIHPEIEASPSQVLRSLITLGIVFGE